MSQLTPSLNFKILWKTAPDPNLADHGLSAPNEGYAYIKRDTLDVKVVRQGGDVVNLDGINVGTLTVWMDGLQGTFVVVPKKPDQDAWKQEFKLETTTLGGNDGVRIWARTTSDGNWVRLRCDGYDDRWVFLNGEESTDDDKTLWRLDPLISSGTVAFGGNGTLTINGSSDDPAEAKLEGWWHWFKLHNATGKDLTVTYASGPTQTVPSGQDFVIVPRGPDDQEGHRNATISVGDDLASITLKMTKINVF